MKNPLALLCVVTTLLLSCDHNSEKLAPHFPTTVTNFEDLNSEYDDFNSNIGVYAKRLLIHFSSNRNSQGRHFDIIGGDLSLDFDSESGKFRIGNYSRDEIHNYLRPLVWGAKTQCDELGPHSIHLDEYVSQTDFNATDVLFYANNCNGNFDIHSISCTRQVKNGNQDEALTGTSQPLAYLNSPGDDLYPCAIHEDRKINGDNWLAGSVEKIIFCSNRDGDFDIYEVNVPDNDLFSLLSTEEKGEAASVTSINSTMDDKCPFVNGKLLVFASNREGGFGGFDLYYSRYENGQYSTPVNFGPTINTQYDEYRPVTLYFADEPRYDNNLMVFSSNRPGGAGGYDLYYVGIEQMIQ